MRWICAIKVAERALQNHKFAEVFLSDMIENQEVEYLKRLSSEIDLIRPDLQRLGFKRDNILILNTEYPDYSAAIDVIFSHLQKPYLGRIREALARLLAHPAAFRLWKHLVAMYQSANKDSTPELMDGLAIALSEQCIRSKSPELRNEIMALLRDQSRGDSRILLLRCFRRKRDSESMALIDELSTDPDLKTEIASWKRKAKRDI